jgi:CHAD domain-containing protein
MSKGAVKTSAKTETQYRFGKGEDPRDAIRRILSEQLRDAVDVLSQSGGSLEKAVHEARRCIKRTRSVLRLIEFAIPKTYSRENSRLRKVGRSLSELRDSHALLETLEGLEERKRADGAKDRAFENAHAFLESRGAQIAQQMTEGGMERSVARLKDALAHVEKLTYTKVDTKGIAKSLYQSVKRGMKAFTAAEEDPEPEKFHEWRKRAKDLRFQLSLLSELRPDLQEYSQTAKELEQLLGDDHNLAVLVDLLREADGSEGSDFRALHQRISSRQSALRGKAKELGEQLYGEKRKVWKHRLEATQMEA